MGLRGLVVGRGVAWWWAVQLLELGVGLLGLEGG